MVICFQNVKTKKIMRCLLTCNIDCCVLEKIKQINRFKYGNGRKNNDKNDTKKISIEKREDVGLEWKMYLSERYVL